MARRRPKMTTKEELLAYLEANQDTEMPFNENVWDKAVETTADKERKYKTLTTTDFDGNTLTKKVPNGSVNPVGKYFQLIALPQYRGISFKQDDEENVDDEDLEFEDEEKVEQVNEWLNMFFEGVKSGDRKYVVERLSNYYDNYELNEGADKFQVVKAVMDELEIKNLLAQRNKGKDVEGRLEKVQKSYLGLLDSLKAMKKQRGLGDESGKNKLTQWIDELERQGEFIAKKDTSYTKDDIDIMLVTLEESIRKVYYEG